MFQMDRKQDKVMSWGPSCFICWTHNLGLLGIPCRTAWICNDHRIVHASKYWWDQWAWPLYGLNFRDNISSPRIGRTGRHQHCCRHCLLYHAYIICQDRDVRTSWQWFCLENCMKLDKNMTIFPTPHKAFSIVFNGKRNTP